jgi:transcriptional regulator with XRE-family HTH domain
MKVYTKLHKTLKKQGRTQAWLARELGKTQNLITQYCNGSTNIPLPMLYQIAELLDMNVKDLLYNTLEEMQKDHNKVESEKKTKQK